MISRILIANRGEIAIRIATAAADLGIGSVAIFSTDDATSLHAKRADRAHALPGRGVAAYLDMAAVIAAARENECDAVHPGYGFLAENAAFARACAEAGLRFIGPSPEILELFGSKVRARQLAQSCNVPLAGGSTEADTPESAGRFFLGLPRGEAMILKAVAGGGGRGMRIVEQAADVEEAFARCSAEAQAAFGDGTVYAERLIRRGRHVEVQVVGDGTDAIHIGERECTLQRRHQKLVEVAPSPSISPALRGRLTGAALTMARAAGYNSLGTFEFLVERAGEPDEDFVFIEANPRLQVEHTVTEEVTGIDLVATQIRIAAGATLGELGLTQAAVPAPRGYAIQLRVNTETMDATGATLPAGGTITRFEPPSGPGIRVDTYGQAGYRIGAAFDSLLAKVIVHMPSGSYREALQRTARILGQVRIEGVETNIPLLMALLSSEEVLADRIHTRTVEESLPALVAAAATYAPAHAADETGGGAVAPRRTGLSATDDTKPVTAPMLGTIVEVTAAVGDIVAPGQTVFVVEALKMQHLVTAPVGGLVVAVGGAVGDAVEAGEIIVLIEPRDVGDMTSGEDEEWNPDEIRPDLAEMYARRHIMKDEGRPGPVAKRHAIGQRTARENIADLLDPDSFIEYGSFVLAAQRTRRSYEELLAISPGDGVVAGLGAVNGDRFPDDKARVAVFSYDWAVFAGTQGAKGHAKKDRLLKIAYDEQIPVVFFTEGGGGRPGDSDYLGVTGLETMTFWHLARLSGLVPLVGISSRFCFAGNVTALGICDVIIATRNSNMGMGGPAMIEGGGLGKVAATDIGPASVMSPNGVIDILVEDEKEAVAAAKKYLSYFQGAVTEWECADQRLLRRVIPENRLRVYEVREVIELLADTGSVLELRKEFGVGTVTALIRIEGRPFGLISNNPKHLGGAVDGPAADKSARFMQLCDAFDIPIIMLCDTPGFMVGPEVEAAAQVRHVSRLFVHAANVTVPIFTIVLRKGYGLGAQGSTGGSFHAPFFLVSWPTGEFGGMGLEGHVKLAFAKELEAITDPAEQKKEYDRLVAELYQKGKALSVAEYFEIDEVIDPAESRRWIMRGLKSSKPPLPRAGKKRPNVDTW